MNRIIRVNSFIGDLKAICVCMQLIFQLTKRYCAETACIYEFIH